MNNQNIEPAFIIPVGNPRVKVNWLDVDHGDVNFGGRDKLLAGCGDNNVYVLNLERLNVVDVLRGHTSYVHCVAAANSAGVSVLSASEDGTVKFWDTRYYFINWLTFASLNHFLHLPPSISYLLEFCNLR